MNEADLEYCVLDYDCIDKNCHMHHKSMKDGKNRAILKIEESIRQLQAMLPRMSQQ
jgi:hypothetical protein